MDFEVTREGTSLVAFRPLSEQAVAFAQEAFADSHVLGEAYAVEMPVRAGLPGIFRGTTAQLLIRKLGRHRTRAHHNGQSVAGPMAMVLFHSPAP